MSELPKGWVETRLEDIADVVSGQSPEGALINEERFGLPFYQGKAEFAEDFPQPRKWCDSPEKIARKGSVLLSIRAPVGPTNFAKEECGIGRGLASINGLGGISNLFVRQALKHVEPVLKAKATGTTFEAITSIVLRQQEIRLPPLAEQKRIVAKLDALNAKSARARTDLARIETLVSRYKQAVLGRAFSGELTREWRVQRANLTSWQYLPLSKLISDGPTNGWSPKADGKVGGLKSLKLSATSSGTLRLNENTIKYLDQTLAENSKYWLLANDILIQRANSLELLGTTVLFEGPPYEFMYPDLMMRVRADERKALPKYLATFLNSDGARTYFRANATGTAGNMPKINGTTVRETRVPAPPLEEQHEIVRRIETAFARIDRLANEAKRALELLGRLDEAILAKAFRGELVPQDENDESAELLLARIRAEREATPKAKRGRGTKG